MYGVGEKWDGKNVTRGSNKCYVPSTSRIPLSFPPLLFTLCAMPRAWCSLEMKREAGVGMHYVKSGAALIKHWPVSLTLHSCVTFVKRRARSTQHYVKTKKTKNKKNLSLFWRV